MGLRDHGDWSIISALFKEGRMEAVAYPKSKVFEAGLQFACTQGTIPAPESTHAICAAIDEALAAKEQGEERVILIDYSGHGLLDLCAYDDFLHDRLADRASGPDGISTQTMTRRPNGTGRARWRR
jgi:tryptophan synthase beta chain